MWYHHAGKPKCLNRRAAVQWLCYSVDELEWEPGPEALLLSCRNEEHPRWQSWTDGREKPVANNVQTDPPPWAACTPQPGHQYHAAGCLAERQKHLTQTGQNSGQKLHSLTEMGGGKEHAQREVPVSHSFLGSSLVPSSCSWELAAHGPWWLASCWHGANCLLSSSPTEIWTRDSADKGREAAEPAQAAKGEHKALTQPTISWYQVPQTYQQVRN